VRARQIYWDLANLERAKLSAGRRVSQSVSLVEDALCAARIIKRALHPTTSTTAEIKRGCKMTRLGCTACEALVLHVPIVGVSLNTASNSLVFAFLLFFLMDDG
jgi:hypothetical protein